MCGRAPTLSLLAFAGWIGSTPALAEPKFVEDLHPAIGSWFGKAIQLCANPNPPACSQISLFMTPTLTADGQFVGNDSLALGGPPFGPHTTAHGRWIPTSNSGIIADYVFMLNGTPLAGNAPTLTVLRFRWHATVVKWDTMQGYVNIFFGADVPLGWVSLGTTDFPVLPNEAQATLTPPANFYTDAAGCSSGPPTCPLIFKFTIKRISP
jgi:hypothetical protein